MFLTSEASNATYPYPVYISTPLIFFPEQLAYQMSVVTYIHIGCTAIVLWDFIDNLKWDYQLLFIRKLGPVTAIYFVMRISLLAYLFTRAVLLTTRLDNCARTYTAINILMIIFTFASTALLYVRVCAVYSMHKGVVVAFGLVWLAVCGMISTVPHTFTATHVAGTQYCVEVIRGDLLGPTWILFTVSNILDYTAIAYRIASMFPKVEEENIKGTFASIAFTFASSRLPIISRALLQGSQLYFFVVLMSNPVLIVFVYAFPNNPPFRVMFMVGHIILVHILATRAYRNIKLGLMLDATTTIGHGGRLVFAEPPSLSTRRHGISNA